jgi:hypothetical protein
MRRPSLFPLLAVAIFASSIDRADAQAITPLPEGTPVIVKFSVSIAAERRTADPDPLGARSHFKVQRSANVTCTFTAGKPRGIGPDGSTKEQQAILDEAESASKTMGEQLDQAPAPGSLQARIEACGEDSACQMRVALEVANDPNQVTAAEAESERNRQMTQPVDEASARVDAMMAEPLWQPLLAEIPPGKEIACEGQITANDLEVYRLGFDGGDMGEGREARTGAAPAEGVGLSVIWFDLANGRVIVDTQLGGFYAVIESKNVGGRDGPRNPGFTLSEDWEPRAGKVERLERGGVGAVQGRWTFAMPIEPKRHDGFQGAADFEWAVERR